MGDAAGRGDGRAGDVASERTGAARRDLVAAARSVMGHRMLRKDFSAGSVGAAIRTAGGNVYTGVCIDLGSGLGFCAEVAAVAQMITAGETVVAAMVAVRGDGILPPCGRCRETVAQLDVRNLDCAVILGEDRDAPLRELLPHHWLDGRDGSDRSPA